MNKIIITIGAIITISCNNPQRINKSQMLYEITNEVQYMKEWMWEDIELGKVDSAYGVWYLQSLNEVEDKIIQIKYGK